MVGPFHRGRAGAGDERDPAGVFVVWVAAGMVGALYAWFRHPADGLVEMMTYARFLAGITVYPEGSPMAYGLAATTTPAHWGLALLIGGGASERFVSLVLNMGTAALYAQSFALLCLALTGRALVSAALGVAPVLTWAFVEGADYPINMVNAPVPGTMGFGLLLLVLGLAGCGRRHWAALALALLAMMHPVYAALAGVLAVGGILAARLWPGRFRAPLDWRALALALAAAGLAWAAARGAVPKVAELPPVEPFWVEVYLDRWDFHRNVPVTGRSLLIAAQAALATVLVGVLAWRSPARLGPAGLALAAMLAAGGVMGCVAWGLFHALRDVLPAVLVLPMPNRFLNLPEAFALAAAAGGIAMMPSRPARLAAIGLLLLTAALSWGATRGHWLEVETVKTVERGVMIAALLAGLAALLRPGAARPDRGAALHPAAHPALSLAAGAALLGGVALLAVAGRPPEVETDATRVVDMVSRTGLVMVAEDSLRPSFLPFRNPLLIDVFQMDLLPYVPRLIPVYAGILKDVYGIDFNYPPPDSTRKGVVAPRTSRAAWAARTAGEWTALGRKWGVRLVLTSPGLQLPLNGVTMDDLAVWEIPAR
ncbi:hypothetical protein [Magnetospirillum sp. SS-4]|uniref:hypothetical protein n=1 Tax=Magnetospirillum sp. SS-4 TaxID=2681465 RepID=UPI001382DF76|nr:hypothetical protein [Magnetospirillum sp. SS-4]CAA7623924.1 membrane hypothetical protein [Magnetospirillum sp. SS-4]